MCICNCPASTSNCPESFTNENIRKNSKKIEALLYECIYVYRVAWSESDLLIWLIYISDRHKAPVLSLSSSPGIC